MKKIIFFMTWIFYSCLNAQVISVRDNSTREPIPNARISGADKVLYTNEEGQADITPLGTSSLSLYHPTYGAIELTPENLKNNELSLDAKISQLDEIILSANRHKEKKIDVPYSVEVIDQKEIEFVNQPTSADLLQNTGAVFVQKSQMGGGSPVLRGFEANRVLLVLDGVRMNNAIYRAGHLQDVITLDPNMLERTEVVFGPASTIYGSDALGGVMHFYTKNARFGDSAKMKVHGNSLVRYATANSERTGHLDFNLGWKKFASLTNITFSDFGDLRSGTNKLTGSPNRWDRNFYVKRFGDRDSMVQNNNNNLQVGTAYSAMDLMQRFSFRTDSNSFHNLNFQFSQSSDIPRYDRLTEFSGANLRFAEWNYGPQKRLFAAYSYENSKKRKLTDNIKLIAAYQKIDQDRISRNFRNNNRTTQEEDVTVLSFNVDAFKVLSEKHELRYGAEIQMNDVTSKAFRTNIATGSVSPAGTRYADGGSVMDLYGIYFSHSWEVNKNFVISDGLRFSMNSLSSHFRDTTFYKSPIQDVTLDNSAVTGNLGFTWKEDNKYKVSFFANTGFRAPNVDDMSKFFENTSTLLIVPNENLKPEYATNFELNLSHISDQKLRIDLTGFYTVLENAMVLSNFQYQGSDSVTINGTPRKVQAMQNQDRAYIYGFTAGLQYDFNAHLSFKTIFNYTYGRYANTRIDTIVPLDHIPPVFGQTSLLYRDKNADGEFFIRYNGKKATADYSASGEDNAQYSADAVNGYMPGWLTLNVRAGYNITRAFRINFSCENITDNRYRVFASGVNAPGRNFIFSLRYKF